MTATRFMPHTPPWNLAALPCASIPTGIGADGLPQSVQVVGPPEAEALILSVAAQVESLIPVPVGQR